MKAKRPGDGPASGPTSPSANVATLAGVDLLFCPFFITPTLPFPTSSLSPSSVSWTRSRSSIPGRHAAPRSLRTERSFLLGCFHPGLRNQVTRRSFRGAEWPEVTRVRATIMTASSAGVRLGGRTTSTPAGPRAGSTACCRRGRPATTSSSSGPARCVGCCVNRRSRPFPPRTIIIDDEAAASWR